MLGETELQNGFCCKQKVRYRSWGWLLGKCEYASKKERDTVQSFSLAIFYKFSVGWAGSPRMSFICEVPAIFGVSEGLALRMSPCSAEFYFERTFGDMPSELALYVAPHGSSRLDCYMRAFTRVMKPL